MLYLKNNFKRFLAHVTILQCSAPKCDARKRAVTKALTIFALGQFLCQSPSFSQASERAPSSQDTLGEVIVTAERREENLQSVPIAVTAVNKEEMKNLQIASSQDLQLIVPSLKMTNNLTSPTNLSPSLRGSAQADASLVVAESPFGIYVDDIYVGRLNGNNVQYGDIDRIEVLRGPQGTLYGRNTLAGAIKFISRTPGDETWLSANVGGGNHDQYRASFTAGGPLNSGWSGSLAGMYNHKDGEWFNQATGQDIGLEKNIATRAKLRYHGIDNFDAQGFIAYSKSDNDALPLAPGTTPNVPADHHYDSNQVVLTYPPYTTFAPNTYHGPSPLENQPRGETKQLISGINLSYHLGSSTIRSITGYVNTKDFFNEDFSGTGTFYVATNADSKQLTQEFQLLGTAFNERLNYILGAFYLHEKATQDFAWMYFTPTATNHIDTTIKSESVFGQLDYKLTDALKATVGARWTQDKKDFDINIIRLPTILPVLKFGRTDPVALANTYSEITPKFGLDYTVPTSGNLDSLLLYASATRGFKSGGYNGIGLFNLNDAQSSYAPETNWTYETGFKTDLLGHKLRLDATYFYEKIRDLALNATVVTSGVPTFPVQNAGKATIKGLEIEVSARPTPGLTLYLNSAFETGQYTELNPTTAPAQAMALYHVSPRPPQLPGLAGTVGFDYVTPVPLASARSRLLFGLDYYRSNSYLFGPSNDFTLSAYDRMNGYIGLGLGASWELRATVRNLQDRHTIISGSRALGSYLLLPPREYLLSINYKL